MIDFHTHVLPGIDDGSASLEESIELLKMEALQGITHVVATPHFYAANDNPDAFLERRQKAFELLKAEAEKIPGLPKISLGAEIYFFRGISQSEAISRLTIEDKRFILLEMPMSKWTDGMYCEIEEIYRRYGITPIMAHMDRYIAPFQTHGIPEKFFDMHVLVQANASYFLKGGLTSKQALKLLKQDKIQLIGSDCHNLTDRAPRIGEAFKVIEEKLGKETLERISYYGNSVFE